MYIQNVMNLSIKHNVIFYLSIIIIHDSYYSYTAITSHFVLFIFIKNEGKIIWKQIFKIIKYKLIYFLKIYKRDFSIIKRE